MALLSLLLVDLLTDLLGRFTSPGAVPASLLELTLTLRRRARVGRF